MLRRAMALCGTILLWADASPLPATTYYVAPGGLNANPGTESEPWRDIQHAADMMVAGDTVYVKAGTYFERVVPRRSGSAGNFITYAAYPGQVVTIDGSSPATTASRNRSRWLAPTSSRCATIEFITADQGR